MFRFTIRDVLWLTVVVALAVGWWVEHQQTSALTRSLSEVDEQRKVLQTTVDSMKISLTDMAARIKSDEYFRRAYDAPTPRNRLPEGPRTPQPKPPAQSNRP